MLLVCDLSNFFLFAWFVCLSDLPSLCPLGVGMSCFYLHTNQNNKLVSMLISVLTQLLFSVPEFVYLFSPASVVDVHFTPW